LDASGFLIGFSKPFKQASMRFLGKDLGIGARMYKYSVTGVSKGSLLPIASIAASLIKDS
jgi:hypothetical protein